MAITKDTKQTTEKKPVEDSKAVIVKKARADKSYDPFEGKYIVANGKRKTSTARVRLFLKGKGILVINGERVNSYFDSNLVTIVNQALKLTAKLKDVNLSIIVKGGGKKGQALAIRHGITKALMLMEPELRPTLKAKGWVTRDSRKKERKKPGLKKARRAPQWSKR